MVRPKAIGFDLFNTLLTIHPRSMEEAHARQVRVLQEEGLPVEAEPFERAYVEAAVRFLQQAHSEGRETHNRFWIADALGCLGFEVSPEDPRIARAVDAYFTAFYDNCRLVPGTTEVLEELARRYPLGMLTNFTHPPAVRRIIGLLGLEPYFKTVLVSGELGYRKPHRLVFDRLVEELGVPADQVLFVGDDPEADAAGARGAGLRPVLTALVREQGLPAVQNPLAASRGGPAPAVPTISCWQDLFLLLGLEDAPGP